MGSINLFGATPSPVGLIERMLGPAYQSVKIVADQIEVIKEIAANIPAVKDAAANMARNIQVIESVVTGALGTTAYVPLPAGVDEIEVLDSTVVLVATDGAIYAESSGHFSSKIVAGYLEVTTKVTAPATLVGASVRWTLSFKD